MPVNTLCSDILFHDPSPNNASQHLLPVQAGFPPYRTPFHETFVFGLLSVGLGIALAAIIN